MNPLFTIGHSTRSLDLFLEILCKHHIEAIGDVRSHPYSERMPWFSTAPLRQALAEVGIRYVYLGEELGARRSESCCYVGGRADYERIAETPTFRHGLDRLKNGLKHYRIALMCSEKEPLDCHRTILVTRYAKEFAEVFHILHDGSLESEAQFEERLMSLFADPGDDLFMSHEEQLESAFRRRGQEIAWVEPESKPVTHEH